jgi:hypothetical protein
MAVFETCGRIVCKCAVCGALLGVAAEATHVCVPPRASVQVSAFYDPKEHTPEESPHRVPADGGSGGLYNAAGMTTPSNSPSIVPY